MPASNPEKFITNSDFATIANDGGPETLSVIFPGGTFINAGDTWQGSADITLGQKNASIRNTMFTSKESSIRYICSVLTVLRTAFISGPVTVQVQITAHITRISATQIRLLVTANNPYSSTMITEAGDETFTAKVSTFISPFLDQ